MAWFIKMATCLVLLWVVKLPSVVIDFTDSNLYIAILSAVFNPLFWNLVARNEFYNHSLSKLCGSPHKGCYLLSAIIFALGILRDARFEAALKTQPHWPALYTNQVVWLGYCVILAGLTLVITSYWKLGHTGTFLGDYFGILLPAKIKSFPFNVMSDPMYVGSTMTFVGTSLAKASQAGLLLSLWIGICYRIATYYEGPFTEKIYQHAIQPRKQN